MSEQPRKRKVELCCICRMPTRAGHRYCSDHRDNTPLPTGEEMLRWIEAQECPLCRDGRTFKMLANHTVKAHGITGDDIRAAAGLGYEARICSPEFTEEHRERMAPILAGHHNLSLGWFTGEEGGNSIVAIKTGARMRAYKRLADTYREDYLRLLAEEMAAPHE